MADIPAGPAVAIAFDADVWEEEVERYAAASRPRAAAQRARRELERFGASGQRFERCAREGADGTRLANSVKLYVPLGRASSADAPYGFVFLVGVGREPEPTIELSLLAFGERHPPRGVRSVYERAHKRLHGRYPDQ